MGRKWGGTVPLWRESWVPIEHNVAWAEVCLPTKCYLDTSSRLATTDMGGKLGGRAPLEGLGLVGLDPHLTQCGHGRGLPPYQVAS